MDVSRDYSRRVAISGRSMQQNVNIARELGYLTVDEEELVRLDQVNEVQPGEVTIITTGSQGEPLSALTRMAMGDHRHIQIVPGDTVIMSSTPVPGNEDLVLRTINHLFKHGAYVVHSPQTPNVHVSGHANREELKLMLNLTRPRYVVPVHGEYRHKELWRRVAEEMGHVVIKLENGDVLEVGPEEAVITDHVTAGAIFVDGSGQSGIEDIVLRDRSHLSQDGIFFVVVSVDAATAEVIAGPDVVTRGAVLEGEVDSITEEAKQRVTEMLSELPSDGTVDWATVRTDLRRTLNKLLQQKTGRRPMVVPVIMEI
jgi:ribonuclease J